MFRKFYPKNYAESTYDINYQKLYQNGYRGIIFDIDNTLVEHGADANKKAIELFEQLKNIGFKACLISNNNEERVTRFNTDIKMPYIYNGKKPSSKNYIKAMEMMETNIDNTVFIGDQLFTDIYGANRIGMMNYAVKPISPKEEIQIVIKRKLEKIVYHFYFKHKKKNIVLIGFMGSGKTSVAKALAQKLDFNFLDTDLLIEEGEKTTINEIFSNKGPDYFRQLETDLLIELNSNIKKTVLSTGGGIILKKKNVKILKQTGKIIYLDASVETIIKRLDGDDTRPLLADENKEAKIQEILNDRISIYKNAADFTIDTNNKTIADIINIIIKQGGVS
ncbi:MAG TPA: YqeG family HAD IIIA-type phosphatase [Clostridiales bacterium]|nr:YqeG family HAD IIIA-type phosphatase [Clostridiales bacterium]